MSAARGLLAAVLMVSSVGVTLALAGGPAAAYWSATPTTTATAVGATLLPPATGSISTVTGTSATVRIATAPASGPVPTAYRVLRAGATVCTTDASLPNTCTESGLLPGNSYAYTVISLVGTAPWISRTSLALTAVTTTPSAPSKPDLATASDTGSSNSDDVTGINTPTLTGGNGSATAGATLFLYDNGGATAIATTTVAANGSWSVTLPVLADGTHAVTAKVGFGSGTQSAASAALALTIDTVLPVVTLSCPPPATGHRNTFAGNQSDNGRAVTVTVDPPGTGSTVVLSVTSPTGGTYSVSSSNNQLTAGRAYNATSTQTDLAGNTGASAVCAFTAS